MRDQQKKMRPLSLKSTRSLLKRKCRSFLLSLLGLFGFYYFVFYKFDSYDGNKNIDRIGEAFLNTRYFQVFGGENVVVYRQSTAVYRFHLSDLSKRTFDHSEYIYLHASVDAFDNRGIRWEWEVLDDPSGLLSMEGIVRDSSETVIPGIVHSSIIRIGNFFSYPKVGKVRFQVTAWNTVGQIDSHVVTVDIRDFPLENGSSEVVNTEEI